MTNKGLIDDYLLATGEKARATARYKGAKARLMSRIKATKKGIRDTDNRNAFISISSYPRMSTKKVVEFHPKVADDKQVYIDVKTEKIEIIVGRLPGMHEDAEGFLDNDYTEDKHPHDGIQG